MDPHQDGNILGAQIRSTIRIRIQELYNVHITLKKTCKMLFRPTINIQTPV